MTPRTTKKEENMKIPAHRIVKNVIRRPWISEKSQRVLENNQYVFVVEEHANKNSIKEEIRRRYGVHAVRVNIVQLPKETKRFRNRVSKKRGMRKAFVFLKKGEKIDIA